jgi:hypothetical protein
MAAAPAAAEPRQELFRVINDQIKNIILNLRASINSNNPLDVNAGVITAIDSLEKITFNINGANQNIGDVLTTLRDRTNIAGITKIFQGQNFNTMDDTNLAGAFLTNSKTTDDTGIITSAIAAGNKNIDIVNLNSNRTVLAANHQQVDYETDNTIDITDDTANILQNRLINCQFLEILYLTKHEELMKIFAFTLHLYDKYTYAIKILLFVLKNLLHRDSCPEPGRPPGYNPPKIRLPKVLIRNIKDLLKDQKIVQEVIKQMKDTVRDTLPNIITQEVANSTMNPSIGRGNLMDPNSPEQQPQNPLPLH